MTTTNGGRIVDQVEGVVQAANERGVHLQGEPDWRNFSKYADPPIAPPSRGARVRLAIDAAGFVRSVEILDAAPATSSPTAAARDRTITRLSVLKTAASFLAQMGQVHEGVKSEHVIPLAEKWLTWVEQDDDEAEPERPVF